MDAITIENLDVVFGQQQSQALALLDQGKSRQEIIDETGQVVGVDNVSERQTRRDLCVDGFVGFWQIQLASYSKRTQRYFSWFAENSRWRQYGGAC